MCFAVKVQTQISCFKEHCKIFALQSFEAATKSSKKELIMQYVVGQVCLSKIRVCIWEKYKVCITLWEYRNFCKWPTHAIFFAAIIEIACVALLFSDTAYNTSLGRECTTKYGWQSNKPVYCCKIDCLQNSLQQTQPLENAISAAAAGLYAKQHY